jgi:hypothetical protein
MKENGKMIKLMVTEFIFTLMVQNMRGIGRRIYRMDMVLSCGRMEVNMKDSISKGKRMGIL